MADLPALPADKETALLPISLIINGERFAHDGDATMPLLWYLRDVLALVGTKYACDDGSCGACKVLVDDKAAHSCKLAMKDLADAEVTTVEGLADRWHSARGTAQQAGSAGKLHPLQQAFIDEDAIQCGFCLPGFLVEATALLERKAKPGDRDIDGIDNLCRCCMYPRIRSAIKRAAAAMQASDP